MSQNGRSTDVAIVGMSCVYPSAPDLIRYWENIIGKVDAVSDPPGEWDGDYCFDPTSDANDRIYCKRGGYLGDLATFDPLRHGIMPNSVDGGEPDQYLALRFAQEALDDAGYKEGQIDPARVEVILGKGTYINRGYTNVVQHGLMVDQTLRILKQLHPEYSDHDLQEIKHQLKESLLPFNAEISPGLVPNMVGGRIANRLNFLGPNFTVDAACASALIATDLGVQDLVNGRCDLAIVGGIHASTPPLILMIFCHLQALSRNQTIRPFDKDADGTVLGEGIGILVLKRLEDAEQNGDRIYALIKGVGTASDGRAQGLLTPRVEGEELAIQRALASAGVTPDTLELIEAHGTGTIVGDATEVQALRKVFGELQGKKPWCALGSVKSMIGHCIPGAGAAGMIKTALALYHKVLPPTLHCDNPNPELGLEQSPLYINREPRPWIHGSEEAPRRAGVNAFGFGGINAHVILEEYQSHDELKTPIFLQQWPTELILLQEESVPQLRDAIQSLLEYLKYFPCCELRDLSYTLNSQVPQGVSRVAIIASSCDDLAKKLAYVYQKLSDPGCQQIKDRQGIFYFQKPLGHEGNIAFVFPGEGSQYVNMFSELTMHFPEARRWFDLMDRAFMKKRRHLLPSQVIYPPPGDTRFNSQSKQADVLAIDVGAEAVFAADMGIWSVLQSLKITPTFVVGHSTGERSALIAAGALHISSDEELIRYILDLNRTYEEFAAVEEVPSGTMLAVGGIERSTVEAVMAASADPLWLAMDNCPSQSVLCGSESTMEWASAQLSRQGAICIPFPLGRAYHTPLFEGVCSALSQYFESLPFHKPTVSIYSCMTAQPMPEAVAELRPLTWKQYAKPVRFKETIENLYDAGARVFIEVGPKGVLTGFVDDILRGKSFLAVASDSPRQSDLTHLNHMLGMLCAHHVPLSLDRLYSRRQLKRLSLDPKKDKTTYENLGKTGNPLPRGLQPFQIKNPPKKMTPEGSSDPASLSPIQNFAHSKSEQSNAHKVGEIKRSTNPPSLTPDSWNNDLFSEKPDADSQGMNAYFNTMENFLEVQTEIIQAYLAQTIPSKPLIPEDRTPSKTSIAEKRFQSAEVFENKMPSEPIRSPVGHSASQSPPIVEANEVLKSGQDIKTLIRDLVAEKTGYPVDMLDGALNLEADLGIDSIKRVEILTGARQQLGISAEGELEKLTTLKTLDEIIQSFVEMVSDQTTSTTTHSESRPIHSRNFGLIGEIKIFEIGKRLESIRVLNPEEDFFLRHHTMGSSVSDFDEELLALPVMPLTMSMEAMAQAASLLVPNKVLIQMQEVRTYRWISIDDKPVPLVISATVKQQSDTSHVEVRIRGMNERNQSVGPVILEASLIFADHYPPAPLPQKLALKNEHVTQWTKETLYSGGMFHGPFFQAVTSIDGIGENGTEGTLEVLPLENAFCSVSQPEWVTDPVILDAAGQLIGYWAAEHHRTGFNVFPFRLERLDFFGPLQPVGAKLLGRAHIQPMGQSQIQSNIELVGSDGRLYMRLVSWEDRAFDIPEECFHLRINTKSVFICQEWPELLHGQFEHFPVVCCVHEPFPPDFLTAHGMIWRRVLAHLVLSRKEREIGNQQDQASPEYLEWLLAQITAKDAVRKLIKKQYGFDLYPADVEIFSDESGVLTVCGPWIDRFEQKVRVSVACTGGRVVGIAQVGNMERPIGLAHLDKGDSVISTLESVTQKERVSLDEGGSHSNDLEQRTWCAKAALGKHLGILADTHTHSFSFEEMDSETGIIQLSLASDFPDDEKKQNTHQVVHTLSAKNLIIGIAGLCE